MKLEKIPFIFDDGGRSASGKFGRKRVGDCVVRALAIAMRRNYAEVHADLFRCGTIGSSGTWKIMVFCGLRQCAGEADAGFT